MDKAERVQLELLRKMSPAEKLECVRVLTIAVQRLAFAACDNNIPRHRTTSYGSASPCAGSVAIW